MRRKFFMLNTGWCDFGLEMDEFRIDGLDRNRLLEGAKKILYTREKSNTGGGLSPIKVHLAKVCARVDGEVKRIKGLRMPLSVSPCLSFIKLFLKLSDCGPRVHLHAAKAQDMLLTTLGSPRPYSARKNRVCPMTRARAWGTRVRICPRPTLRVPNLAQKPRVYDRCGADARTRNRSQCRHFRRSVFRPAAAVALPPC